MKFEVARKKAFLAHLNARSELHGTERQSASDIKFKLTMPNAVLDQFHGTLKHALYFNDVSNPGKDLADKAMEGDPNHLPHRRFPNVESPIKWKDEMTGGKLTVHFGLGGPSDIIVPDIKVNEFRIYPEEGGTVKLEIRVQGHPDAETHGKLYDLIQKEVEITIEAPQAEADLLSQAKPPVAAEA